MDNKIVLLILPPHTSHMTQPLDVGVFGPLKKVMAAKIAPLISTGISRIQKVEWLSAFAQAHAQVFNAQNIQGGFRGTGIVPFDPLKVHGRLPQRSPTPIQTRQSTPSIDTPFNNTVLTSSPVDSNAVTVANTALNTLVKSREPFNTPARNYVNCVTRTNDRLRASNSILRKQNEDMQGALAVRRTAMSGKRKIIEGKNVMTTLEIRDAVMEWQNGRKKQKTARGTKGKKKAKAKEVWSEESDSDLGQETEEEREIMDCIEVEM
jgi:hypothetical protein